MSDEQSDSPAYLLPAKYSSGMDMQFPNIGFALEGEEELEAYFVIYLKSHEAATQLALTGVDIKKISKELPVVFYKEILDEESWKQFRSDLMMRNTIKGMKLDQWFR